MRANLDLGNDPSTAVVGNVNIGAINIGQINFGSMNSQQNGGGVAG